MSTPPPALLVEDLWKAYGPVAALRGASFTVAPGQVVALLGPSGCGKSTVLRIVSGVEPADAGAIHWQGHSLARVATHRRGFGLMFQDHALFPHLTVHDNVAFGLRMAGQTAGAVRVRVDEMLALVGLEGLGGRDVAALSGGEQQRVALARSLAPAPRLLMLDEPMGSIDRALRERLLGDLRRILHDTGQTAIYVTHDQEEAFAIADRVAVMRQGFVVREGTPEDVYRHPATVFVAEFLGLRNIFTGRARASGDEAGLLVDTPVGAIPLPAAADVSAGQAVTILLRPDALTLAVAGQYDAPTAAARPADDDTPTATARLTECDTPAATARPARHAARLTGTLVRRSFRGIETRATVQLDTGRIEVRAPSAQPLPPDGTPITIAIDPAAAVQVLAPDG